MKDAGGAEQSGSARDEGSFPADIDPPFSPFLPCSKRALCNTSDFQKCWLRTQEPALLTERDTVNADGTFNRAAILRVAMLRAAVERDIDVLVAAHGPMLRLPAGISQDNVAAWRGARAAEVDRAGLRLTPFRKILAGELRRVWQAAHAVRASMRHNATPATAATPAPRVLEAA